MSLLSELRRGGRLPWSIRPGKYSKDPVPGLSLSVPIDVTRVVSRFADVETDEWLSEHAPDSRLLLPFDNCWWEVDLKVAGKPFSPEETRDLPEEDLAVPSRIAVHSVRQPVEEPIRLGTGEELFFLKECAARVGDFDRRLKLAQSRYVVIAQSWTLYAGVTVHGLAVCEGLTLIGLGASGEVLGVSTVLTEAGETVSVIGGADARARENGLERLAARLMVIPSVLLRARNVRLQAAPEDPRAAKARARGREPRGVTWRTLVVDLGGRTVPFGSGRQALSAEGANRLHLCRGHLKTYTPDLPLLGRHVGTWWWEPQVRGRRELGVVNKDYELQPGAALASEQEKETPHGLSSTSPESRQHRHSPPAP